MEADKLEYKKENETLKEQVENVKNDGENIN